MNTHLLDTLLESIDDLRAVIDYQTLLGVTEFNKPAPPTLEELKVKILSCNRCDCYQESIAPLFGEGNRCADLMFIEDSPEEEENSSETGSNTASSLLTKIINAIGLKREDVFITTIIKCPLHSRRPSPKEVALCKEWILEQIKIIQPTVICTMGTLSTQTLLNTSKPLADLRGRFYRFNNYKVMPTYHPAILIKTPDKKREVWEDMKKIKVLLAR